MAGVLEESEEALEDYTNDATKTEDAISEDDDTNSETIVGGLHGIVACGILRLGSSTKTNETNAGLCDAHSRLQTNCEQKHQGGQKKTFSQPDGKSN
jgi:hypothetical protein